MKWNVFCASKNHIPRGKGQNCHICLRSGWERWPPSPYGQPDRKIPGVFLTASLRQRRWWWWWKKAILMGIGNFEFDIWRENLRRLDGWRLSRSHFVAQGQLFNKPAKCAGGERGEQKWVQNRRWTKIKCRWQKPFQWRQPCACSGNRVKDVIENKIN